MVDEDVAQPQWISPPGEIVAQILETRRMDLDDFATNVGLSARSARDLIEGTIPIDRSLAERLSRVVGSTASFWIRCEQSYRKDIDRNLPAHVDDEVRGWLKQLPLKDMSKLGWIELRSDPVEQARECFRFFGIVSLDDWKHRQSGLMSNVNFRTSETFSHDPLATSAWLRKAEEYAEEAVTAAWNRSYFQSQLSNIRNLTRNHHPERFLPKLRSICADSGVALVILPAPKGCTASGATKLIRRRKAMLAMSFRYFADDHFWFTFFHEAAHLILHADHELFLENSDTVCDQAEAEANTFAADTLVSPQQREKMQKLPPLHHDYIQFAAEIGIAPGIVVGQMQKLGLLPFSRLRKLKRRFEWEKLYERGVIP